MRVKLYLPMFLSLLLVSGNVSSNPKFGACAYQARLGAPLIKSGNRYLINLFPIKTIRFVTNQGWQEDKTLCPTLGVTYKRDVYLSDENKTDFLTVKVGETVQLVRKYSKGVRYAGEVFDTDETVFWKNTDFRVDRSVP